MSAPFVLSNSVNLIVAVVVGVFFGFFLERGGLGNPHKLTGVFYLTDFAVPKAMFPRSSWRPPASACCRT
jgi:hypothetical protein